MEKATKTPENTALHDLPTIRKVEFSGEAHSIKDWAKITGLPRETIVARLECGCPVFQALTVPVGGYWDYE